MMTKHPNRDLKLKVFVMCAGAISEQDLPPPVSHWLSLTLDLALSTQ